MKITKKFNQLTIDQYIFYIDNYKKYTNFNVLGIYRSIVENCKLTIEQKIKIRDYTHQFFKKSFDFFQLKDPYTFFEISNLGLSLTKADEAQFWKEIQQNQQKILSDKKIKHRNFGIYSKHNCTYEHCYLNGLMVKQGTPFKECSIHFGTDKNQYAIKEKFNRNRAMRKNRKKIILNFLEEQYE